MPGPILLIVIVTLLVSKALGRGLSLEPRVKPTPGFIIPYKDAHCTNYFQNSKRIRGSWARYYDYKFQGRYPSCSNFSDEDFSGAENGNALGYNVFWSVPDPDPGCKILILERVSQQKSSVKECGNVVLAVDHAGCYETASLPNSFMLQYCCGNDCYSATGEYRAKRALENSPSVVHLEGTALDPGHDKMSEARLGTIDQDLIPNHGDPAAVSLEDPSQSEAETNELALNRSLDASASVLEARRRHCRRRKHCAKGKFHCKRPENLGDIFTRAGQQTRLTDTLQCDACQPCTQAVTPTIQVSHSITNTKTTTFSDSESMDLSVDAGVDLIAGLKGTFGVEIGHSIAHAFGITDTMAVSKTVSETYSQAPGTHGFIWFTPTLTCRRMSVYCEGGKPAKGGTIEVEACEPELKADGSVLGDLGFESTD